MKARIINLELVILGEGGEEVVSQLSGSIIERLLKRTDGIMEETASGANNLEGNDFRFAIISTMDGEEVHNRSHLKFDYSNDGYCVRIEQPQSRR